MKVVSLILARAGSKGIINKNIYPLHGKPLINYTINASLNSCVNETYVSTDGDQIKKIALDAGAKVIDRPIELSQDHSSSDDALLHFASLIDFDYLVFIQPTSPLLESQYINKGIETVKTENVDSVFSAHKEHWVPRWTLDIKPDGWNINSRPRRQEVEEKYVENGAFYITSKKSLISSSLRYSGNIAIVEMPAGQGFQIDTMEDIHLMHRLLNY